jgi:hypothetical protein
VALIELLLMWLALSTGDPSPPGASGSTIEIAGYRFDPRAGEPTLPPALRAAADSSPGWWLVQLHETPRRETRQALRTRFKLQLTRYVPQNAYLERLDAARIAALHDDARVRAVVPFHPAYKLSPALRAPAANQSSIEVVVTLFPGGDPAPLRALAIGEVLGAGLRYRMHIASERLHDLARLETVRWIEVPPRRDEDDR